jgi:hypothetical protein
MPGQQPPLQIPRKLGLTAFSQLPCATRLILSSAVILPILSILSKECSVSSTLADTVSHIRARRPTSGQADRRARVA